jgi:hypothetical protein
VKVPLDAHHRGKVSVQYQQQVISYAATTDWSQPILPGEIGMIIHVSGAIVTVLPESALYSNQAIIGARRS